MKENSFDKQLRYNLWSEAGRSLESASSLEKDMLEQHRILRDITFVPDYLGGDKFLSGLTTIIGTGQGLEVVDQENDFFLNNKLYNRVPKNKIIITGGIGVSLNQFEETNRVGISAKPIAQMISEQSPTRLIGVENFSFNTPEQAQNLHNILEDGQNVLLFLGVWHAPRFYMTMIKEMPKVNFYTHYCWRDENHFSSAKYDYGQLRFQAPLFISEIARLHLYVEEDSGPCTPEFLMKYMSNLIPNHKATLDGKKKQFEKELLPLWNKTHKDILEKSDAFINYR